MSTTTIETHGIDVIPEHARKGRPRSQFWPWAAGNIHVLSISWGGYLLGYGLSFWQALVISLLSVVGSFALVGLVSLAGQRGSAPTMVLSRRVFGRWGNIPAGIVGYLLVVGWEIVLTSLAVLSTATVAERLGLHAGTGFMVVVLLVMEAIVVGLGVLGFDAIMASQKWITSAVIIVSLVYLVLALPHVRWGALQSLPSGGASAMIGAAVMVFCGFGVGWTSCAADYSRYLPRNASRSSLVGWTTLGGSVPVAVFIVFGLLLCGSDPALMAAIVDDPIGALTNMLPLWFVVPFWLVAVTALVAGAVIDIYSSGLALLAIGVRLPRWSTALVDG
ncbi:MAG TPA: cytosine permease, partial [Candidatus Luteococcus avicola]|nr:cytosine permease [Candidatus Luteococcus avicola]